MLVTSVNICSVITLHRNYLLDAAQENGLTLSTYTCLQFRLGWVESMRGTRQGSRHYEKKAVIFSSAIYIFAVLFH